MPEPTPHYLPEFKRGAVRLYRSLEKAIPKMAEDLGVASESLRRCVKQYEVDAGEREGLSTSKREELSKLCRENRTLKQERDFLKKKRRRLYDTRRLHSSLNYMSLADFEEDRLEETHVA